MTTLKNKYIFCLEPGVYNLGFVIRRKLKVCGKCKYKNSCNVGVTL